MIKFVLNQLFSIKGIVHEVTSLGRLNFAPAAINMKEVNISGEKNMMITRNDRKIFNVQKDIPA